MSAAFISRENREELANEVDHALEAMSVDMRTKLQVEVVGNAVVITIADAATRDAEFTAAMDEVNRRYAECFSNLAK